MQTYTNQEQAQQSEQSTPKTDVVKALGEMGNAINECLKAKPGQAWQVRNALQIMALAVPELEEMVKREWPDK